VEVYAIVDGKDVQISDGPCVVDGECGDGEITCIDSISISNYITSETGGTLQLKAKGFGPWTTNPCGDGDAYFEVQYLISSTYTPSNDAPSDTAATEIDSSIPWGFVAGIAAVMAIFGALLSDTRKDKTVLYKIDGFWIQYALIVFGCTFGSQDFFAFVCFLDVDYIQYGWYMVAIKVIMMMWNGFYLYNRRLRYSMDWDLISEQRFVYNVLGTLCCLQAKLAFLLPWHKSDVAKTTFGFPTFGMYVTTSCMIIVESLLVAIVDVMFAIYVDGIFDLSLSTRISFFLSMGITVFFVLMTIVEMVLVSSSYQSWVTENGTPPTLTEKLID
jgi:hypothetical protein